MTVLKKFIGLAAFAIILSVCSASEARAQNVLGDILKRMDDNNKGLKTLKSSIKMSKHNAQLDEYDVYEGSVQYLPAAVKEKINVRIDWAKPVVEHLAVGNGEYILYRPRLGQAIIVKGR